MAKLTLVLATLLFSGLATQATARSFDDRVDPVPIGENVVYEIHVDVSSRPAPGVVVTLTLPAGATFVSAVRQPSYAAINGSVSGNQVRFVLGDEPSCNRRGLPACADIWALVNLGGSIAPGTVMQASVVVTSSDPARFPSSPQVVYTSAGSLAIRKGRLTFSADPGHDRLSFEADVGRNGWPSPNDPLPTTLDVSGGIRVRLGGAGKTPVVDVTVPGDAFKCSGSTSQHCRLVDPNRWRPFGLDRLNIFLPYPSAQRNNADVLVQTADLTLPPDIGPEMALTIDAAGKTYTDSASFVARGHYLTYAHTQRKP